MNRANEVLHTAKELLIKDGWCQGQLKNDTGQRCAAGAIYDTGDGLLTSGQQCAMELLGTAIGDLVGSWNDKRGRTLADVLEMFDNAIALADADSGKGSV